MVRVLEVAGRSHSVPFAEEFGIFTLAAAAGAYIIAFTIAQGLIALQAYPKLTVGWAVGAIYNGIVSLRQG
jgi:hypothetical protein